MASQFGGIAVDSPAAGSQFGGIPINQQPSYTDRLARIAGDDLNDIPNQISKPFQLDNTVGPPMLQQLGDIGGRIGSIPMDLVQAAFSPAQAGIEAGANAIIPAAAKAMEPLIGDVRFKAGNVTPDRQEQLARDIGQVGVQPLMIPGELSESAMIPKASIGKDLPSLLDNTSSAPLPPPTTSLPAPPVKEPPAISPQAWGKTHDILKTALEEEGIKPEDIATSLETAKATGLPLTAMDVASKDVGGVQTQGRNLLGLADAAANMPGQGAAMAGEVAARGGLSKQRIAKAFDDNISGNKYYDVLGDAEQGQEGAGPLYSEAYARNQSVRSPDIDRILQTPAGQSALKAASVKMQNDMSLMGVSDPELVEQAKLTGDYIPGNGGIAAGLKLRSLDYVKRALDDQIGTAQRAGENDNVRILSGLKNNLVGALDAADTTKMAAPPSLKPGMLRLYADSESPGKFSTQAGESEQYIDIPSTKQSLARIFPGNEPDTFYSNHPDILNGTKPTSSPGLYAQARSTYATGARIKDALDKGRGFMSMDKEEIASYLKDKNVSNPEKKAFAAGVRRELADRMGNVGDGANAITALWKDKIRDRLEPLFANKDAYDKFSQHMQHEQTMARNNGMLTRGSQTNMRGKYQEHIAAPQVPTASKVVKTVIEPQGALANWAGDMMTKALQKRANGMSQDTAAGIMHYLTSSDPEVWKELAANLNPKSKATIPNVRPLTGSPANARDQAKGKLKAILPAASLPPQGNQPIGLRNNNPGNIKGADGKFKAFTTAQEGIEALTKNLIAYNTKHGINTIHNIISRWAPSSENNTNAYIAAVSRKLGLPANTPLNMKNPMVIAKLADAIINHENGRNPFRQTQILNAALSSLHESQA